jgi:uncharacterized protein (TIGR03437 family)
MKTLLLVFGFTPIFAIASPPASSLQFVPAPGPAAQGVVAMPGGDVVIFGAVSNPNCNVIAPGSCDQTETPLLSVLTPSGSQSAVLASSAFGSGNSSIAGVAIDANGNLWVAGETDSDDFPLVHALFTQKPDYQQTGFVAKLDPNLNILFSTFLGGQPSLGQSSPVGIVLDSSGDASIVGITDDPNFPTTAAVFGVGVPFGNVQSSSPQGPVSYTFMTKISANGSSILYSRLMGGNGSPCRSNVSCFQFSVYTRPYAAAVGPDGSLIVAGSTNATNFPVTPNAYPGGAGAFVSRISADGSQLIWSTEFGMFGLGVVPPPSFFESVAVDSANEVYLTGHTFEPIPTTPSALQSQAQLQGMGIQGTDFAVKLSSDATQELFATNLTATTTGVTLDSAGNAWITGNTLYSTSSGKVNPPNFPGLSNIPPSGLDFALELNTTAPALQQIFSFLPPTVTQPPAFDSNGNLLLLASAGNLLRLNAASALAAPALFAITDSATEQATASMAPGELVTFYGVGLGPSIGISGVPDQSGFYPTVLGGVTVEINNVAAPLLYVGPNQINFQVPFLGRVGPNLFSVPTTYTVVVTTPTGALPTLQPQMLGSVGIFGVVNEDGTINSASNPAPDGSIVAVYLTGLGAPSTSAHDGAISQGANSAFLTSIEVKWPYLPLGVLYAGTAPGLINGLDQVNVQLPPGVKGLPLVIETLPSAGAPATSNTVQVYAQ